jgi:hypothetical protein
MHHIVKMSAGNSDFTNTMYIIKTLVVGNKKIEDNPATNSGVVPGQGV